MYIGQTKPYFEDRLKEHIRSDGNPNLYKSGLSNNMKKTRHKFNFNKSTILGTTNSTQGLNTLEMVQIKNHNDCTVNFQNDSK